MLFLGVTLCLNALSLTVNPIPAVHLVNIARAKGDITIKRYDVFLPKMEIPAHIQTSGNAIDTGGSSINPGLPLLRGLGADKSFFRPGSPDFLETWATWRSFPFLSTGSRRAKALRGFRGAACGRLRYPVPLAAGPCKEGISGTQATRGLGIFFVVRPLRKRAFDGTDNKKTPQQKLRCH